MPHPRDRFGLVFADQEHFLYNALKFTDSGEVRLSVSAQPDQALGDRECIFPCEVTDTGIGIPLDQKESIFEAFYQEAGGASREVQEWGWPLPNGWTN